MRTPAICLCFSVLLFSCDNKQVPEGKILSNDKMQAVMWDIIQADVYTEVYLKKDSSKNIFLQNAALQKNVFSLHQISKEDFYKSYDFYSSRSSDMRILLDSISAKAERQRNKKMEKRYSPTQPTKPSPQR
jgi:Domain of unknown function (DUF4296)